MTSNYIQIGKDYRLTEIGGQGSNFYQVWKQISGGSYRKCNLQISILTEIDFNSKQFVLHSIINWFIGKKSDTKGYIISPVAFKEFQDISTENILQLASNINPDETITIFHKTK